MLSRLIHDRRLRYLLVGGWNTGFGYFVSLVLYQCLAHRLHIVLIGIIANIINISMSFFTYKIFVFKTRGNPLYEYLRSYVVYGAGAIIGIIALWLLVDGLHFPFWIAQGMVVAVTVVISYFGHLLFTFRKKLKSD